MSNNYVPNVTDLLAGELARATDINLRYSYVVSGFDKLPTPLSAGGGFSVPVPVGEPTQASHAATKNYMDTTVVSAAQTAAVPAAQTAALAAVAPEVTNAANSATAAANSATSAAAEATTAGNHAATSLTHANTSLTHSNTSSTHAATSLTHANTSLGHANTAQSTLNSFQAIYLGEHASAPSTSGVGEGSLYWNSTQNQLYVLDSGSWNQAAFNVAGAVIAANNLSDVADAETAVTNLGLAYNRITVTVAGGKFLLDGTAQQKSTLTPSVKYRFDQSDSSNAGHPIKFSTTNDGTHAGGTAFTTGVTSVGVPGQAGAYTEITVEQDSAVLYYYCQNHSGMGARAYAATSGGGTSGGASASTGDMTGYYVVATPPDNIIFKPTYTVMPTDFTVVGTFQGFTGEATVLHISDVVTIETDGSYIADDTSIASGHIFYKLFHIADGKSVTVGNGATLQGLGEAPTGDASASAQDRFRSSGELLYFGNI